MPAMPTGAYDFTAKELPTPTRLYNLEPIGIGTGKVESLSSYFLRLANAHHVSVQMLLKQEIHSVSVDNYISTGTYCQASAAFNGSATTALRMVDALSILTGRSDLVDLTLLWSVGRVSTEHAVRRHQAWCPYCFAEWINANEILHIPLAWCLNLNPVCTNHDCLLEDACAFCGRQHFPLMPNQRMGCCPHCGSMLTKPSRSRQGPDQFQLEAGLILDIFLERGCKGLPPPGKSTFEANVSRIMKYSFKGPLRAFARRIGVGHYNIIRAMNGAAPSLDMLLRIAILLGVDPVSLCSEEILQINLPEIAGDDGNNIAPRIRRRRLNRDQFRTAAEGIHLRNPALSSKAISRRIKMIPETFARCFPDLHKRIVTSHLRHVAAKKKDRLANLEAQVKKVTTQIFKSGRYPCGSLVRAALAGC